MKYTQKQYIAISKDGKQVVAWDTYYGTLKWEEMCAECLLDDKYVWESREEIKRRLSKEGIKGATIKVVTISLTV